MKTVKYYRDSVKKGKVYIYQQTSLLMVRVDNLPRHGRSRDILQHQSSFHTHTGTWHICTGCPSTPDETARNMRALTSRTKKKKKSESMSDQVNQHLATFIYLFM